MSVWTTIVAMAQRAFEPEAEAPEPGAECAPEPGDVGFTAAVIGLAAKMAKVDGAVTPAEIAAAARVFRPPPGEEAAFARAFAIARQSVHGFDSYARQIGRKYRARPCLLEDVLDGLFQIALADGSFGPRERLYLETVADRFGFTEGEFRRIEATNLGLGGESAFGVLGLEPGATLEEATKAWRRLVAENHPDQMIARGAPDAFVTIAHQKTAAINAAYEDVKKMLRPAPANATSAA